MIWAPSLSHPISSPRFTACSTTAWGAGLPTIVTTNITDGSLLEKRYTEKISSRLSAFVPFNFVGEDIRAQKASE